MKYLVTLIVCACLAVGLILFSRVHVASVVDENGTFIATPEDAAVTVVMLTLPIPLLIVTIWAVIGFTKTVNRWYKENQAYSCPPVLLTKDADERDAAMASFVTFEDELEDLIQRWIIMRLASDSIPSYYKKPYKFYCLMRSSEIRERLRNLTEEQRNRDQFGLGAVEYVKMFSWEPRKEQLEILRRKG